ncbi:MAG: UDP-N-acetylglucosamine--N-acetylmuramyl-(pentapeptide) pyrophosphoryl-undecaprenol N-acetylglucosamine transferase, partial [Planctomycetota bacterium]
MDTPESLPHVLFAGGGTGGHLYPGLALAKALQARAGRIWITFVGTAHGLDAELAPAAGFPLYTVPAGRGSPLSLRRPWNAVRFVQSVTACRRIFRMRPPDVVVGLGGFAAAPAGLAARWAGVPLVLLEQNVLPGRVTRLLSRWAAEIHLQFDEARTRLPRARGAVLHSGSPLRAELAALADGPPVDGDRLLVMGGSQGARRLNELVCAG